MADIITYEQFCAARKAKMEKIEAEKNAADAEWMRMYNMARDAFYAEAEKNAADLEWMRMYNMARDAFYAKQDPES